MLAVGGNTGRQVELFSPKEGCQLNLAPLPVSVRAFLPSLAFVDGNVIACPSYTPESNICWSYNISENVWSSSIVLKYTHSVVPGIAFDNKLYIIDDVHPEVYDPRNNSLSLWPVPPRIIGELPCLVLWKDTIIAIGGLQNQQLVLSFNTSSKLWSILNESSPFSLYGLSCILLPTDDVLVAGPYFDPYKSALYNIKTYSWMQLNDVKYNRAGSTMFSLNGRIFIMGSNSQDVNIVEEYISSNKTWIALYSKPKTRPFFTSTLPLPANLFANLPLGCKAIL